MLNKLISLHLDLWLIFKLLSKYNEFSINLNSHFRVGCLTVFIHKYIYIVVHFIFFLINSTQLFLSPWIYNKYIISIANGHNNALKHSTTPLWHFLLPLDCMVPLCTKSWNAMGLSTDYCCDHLTCLANGIGRDKLQAR